MMPIALSRLLVIGALLSGLVALCSCFSASPTDATPCVEDLRRLGTYDLRITEPSGLCLYTDSTLLCVGDQVSEVYVINTVGERLSLIDIKGRDSEGISYDPRRDLIYTVDEDDGKLRVQPRNGDEAYSTPIISGSKNGLEGCSIDSEGQLMYMLKEDKDGELIIRDLESGDQEHIVLDFAKDYSGIHYEASTQELWILSDRSNSLSRCDLKGQVEQTYRLCIEQAEGIAVDVVRQRIYVVSDAEAVLVVFELPD